MMMLVGKARMPRAVVVLRIPHELKDRLNGLRARGYTINGYITHLIEQEFARTQQPAAPAAKEAVNRP